MCSPQLDLMILQSLNVFVEVRDKCKRSFVSAWKERTHVHNVPANKLFRPRGRPPLPNMDFLLLSMFSIVFDHRGWTIKRMSGMMSRAAFFKCAATLDDCADGRAERKFNVKRERTQHRSPHVS